jgi:CheY-like chemotaxis protein
MLERVTPRPFPLETRATSLDLLPMVLIAENDRGVRQLLRSALEADHLKVWAASDGQEALAIAEAWMVDLLVTDVVMPRLDGFGLIRAVRRLYPTLPVIVTSGNDFYRDRPLAEVAAEFQVESVLLKPFNIADLERAVRTALPRDLDPPGPRAEDRIDAWSRPGRFQAYPATH